MASVSGPGDGGYSYYHKSISDLEDEYADQKKRANERQETREARMESNRADTDLRREEQLDRTIANVKSNANETIAQEREIANAEIKRMKKEGYDRLGRSHGVEADVLKDQLASQEKAHRAEVKQLKSAYEDATDGYSERAQEMHREQQEKIDQQLRDTHDRLTAAYEERSEANREELREMHEKSDEKINSVEREKQQELVTERRHTLKAIEDMERAHKHATQQTEKSNEKKWVGREQMHDHELTDAVHLTNETHVRENRQLRDKVTEILDHERRYGKDASQARSDAYRELEDEQRTQTRIMQDSYIRKIDKLHQQAKDADSYFAHLQDKTLKEKDTHFAKVISDQNRTEHLNRKDLQESFTKERDALELRRQREADASGQRLDQALAHSSADREKALYNQARAYQTTMANQKTSDGERIASLEREIQRRSTSSDSSDISPAAEEAVRNSVSQELYKAFDEEKNRNRRSEDHIQRNYRDRLEATVRHAEERETKLSRSGASETHRLLQDAQNQMEETEYQKQQALVSMRVEQDRQQESFSRTYGQSLEKQRHEYEQIIHTLREDASNRLDAQRQENEFASRMTHRTFAQRQNELIREYDRKLADQKLQYEAQLEGVKSEAAKTIRDSERQTKQALEDQSRSYDQRIAQLEMTNKEREKRISENYEDSLEKLKRSNALLIQKKS
jgi:hypothetical protein